MINVRLGPRTQDPEPRIIMKLVSIIIPAYNKAELTVKTVESVLAQTYSNIEIIVVDDGSKDNTEELMRPYADQGKIRYIKKENGGACSARNVGIHEAKGDYLGFLDCDDLYMPEKVSRSVEYLEKNREAGLVHNPSYLVDNDEKIIGTYFYLLSFSEGTVFEKLITWPFICNSTVIARKECFDKVGSFDESIFMPADWEMWLRISKSYGIGFIREFLTKYRKESRYIIKNLEKRMEEEVYVIDKTLEGYSDRFGKIRRKALANAYFRNANGFLSIKEFEKALEDINLSIREKGSVKSLGLKALMDVFKSNIYNILWNIGLFTAIKKKLIRAIFLKS